MVKVHQVSGVAIAILMWIGCIGFPGLGQSSFGQSPNVVLSTSNGETFEGSIISIDLDRIKLQTAERTIEFEVEKVDSIDTGNQSVPPAKIATSIELVDGSSFNGGEFSIESGNFSTQLECGIGFSANTRDIEALRFKSYQDNLVLSQQYRKIQADDSREGDTIVVNRDGELSTVEGIVGDFADGKLEFSISDRAARVALKKMDAVLFYHAADRELAQPTCKILLTDDSRALVRRLKWSDRFCDATLVCGTELTIPLESISRMDFSIGKDEFLSQMEPTTNDWNALITSPAIVEKLRRLKIARINESFRGLPLALKFSPNQGLSSASEVRQFDQGFAVQGGGKLAFSLGGRFQKLTGLVGFDPAANITGRVKFTVLLDGKPAVEQVLIHRKMKNPFQLDVEIKDAKRVVFQVDYQDGRSTGDQLHLVNLKVTQ